MSAASGCAAERCADYRWPLRCGVRQGYRAAGQEQDAERKANMAMSSGDLLGRKRLLMLLIMYVTCMA